MNPPPTIRAGFAFWLAGNQSHLYVVVTDPNPSNGQIAFTNLVTHHPNNPDPVVLQRGAHPFVQSDTTLAFKRADVQPVKSLLAAYRNNQINGHNVPFSSSAIEKIRRALIAHPNTPQKVRAFLSTAP